MRPARRGAHRHPRHPRHPARLGVALVAGLFLTSILPSIPVAARGPVDVRGQEIAAAVDHAKVIPLPFEASHVALRWHGTDQDRLTIAFGLRPNELGEEVPVPLDHAAEEGSGEVASGVLWTGGARFARVTTSRPIGSLKLLAMDAVGDRGPAIQLGGGNVANAAVGMPPVISRAGWGANESYRFDSGGYQRFPPHYAPLQKVIVHHTAGRNNDPDPEATVRAIYYLHAVNRGYGDIDYNFLIDWQGRVYEGRHARDYAGGEPITGEDLAGNVVRGAHASDFNDATVGIALLGNFVDRLPPTAQTNALETLIAWKLERHGINPLGEGTYTNPAFGNSKFLKNISGHRDVNQTACPGGTFYNWFPTLRQNVANRIAATTGAGVDHTAPGVISLLPMTPDQTGATSIPFGLLFEEPVSGVEAADFSVGGTSPGWTIGSVKGKASRYTVTVVAPPGGGLADEGTVTLTLGSEEVQDAAGNIGPTQAAEGKVAYVHDPDAPTVVLWQTPHELFSTSSAFDWTVTFSEPVLGFEVDDIAIGGPDADEWGINYLLGSGISYGFTTRQPSLTNGTFTVSIPAGAVTDLAGNPIGASKPVTLKVDRSKPAMTWLGVGLRGGTTLDGANLRAEVLWTASDVGPAGVGSYDVARSVDGGPFTTIASKVTGTALGVSLTPGHSYRFEVRPRDKAGNVGGWLAGSTFNAALTQQSSSAVRWAGASGFATSSSYSGGSARYLKAGASASYTTTARSLSFITTKAPNRGVVRIYVDGVLAATVDLRAAAYTYRYVAFSKRWSSVGTHTIRVVSVDGETPRVDVDAFGVTR
jgi:hypothetical protein